MAVVGNQNQLTLLLLLLCIITCVVIPPAQAVAQVITCDDLFRKLLACANFVMKGEGPIPKVCCGALKMVLISSKTKQERQSVCECTKARVAKFTPDQLKRARDVPIQCQLPVFFRISPDVNCSQVSTRIN
nr:non-specific lipid-transfer protein 1-like [Ipomoea trifida]